MRLFGLIGYPLEHSFSKKYFTQKFEDEDIQDAKYVNFPLQSIEEFPALIKQEEQLTGLNVTLPYKEQVLEYLDDTEEAVKEIKAVNTIKIYQDNAGKKKLKGFNTDYHGFIESLEPLLSKRHHNALILGTGGASKAVAFALKKLNISFRFVSRNAKKKDNTLSYSDINEKNIKGFHLIVNTTPLGMHPNTQSAPQIPYQALTKDHILYDLVYNPKETKFMSEGKKYGAITKNGLDMLYLQAEKAWEIWNSSGF